MSVDFIETANQAIVEDMKRQHETEKVVELRKDPTGIRTQLLEALRAMEKRLLDRIGEIEKRTDARIDRLEKLLS